MNESAYRCLMAIAVGWIVLGTASGQDKKVDPKMPIVRQLRISVGSTVRARANDDETAHSDSVQ